MKSSGVGPYTARSPLALGRGRTESTVATLLILSYVETHLAPARTGRP